MSLSNPRAMPSTLLPFLYQTRTLRRACGISGPSRLARQVYSSRKSRTPRPDNSIPFARDSPLPQDAAAALDPSQVSTITPSEAQIFKGIFDEIAQGKLRSAKKRNAYQAPGAQSPDGLTRVTDFRERILRRYPQSLRDAAQVALGLFEMKPEEFSETEAGEPGKPRKPLMVELDGGNQRKWEEHAKQDLARAKELERVELLMKKCNTDEELWEVMGQEVFSLPAKLGILQDPETDLAKGEESQASANETLEHQDPYTENEEEKRIMDIHGPLYSQFISMALGLFETAFVHPSPYVFQILPRVKELGLPSYVLGVSTPFYHRLAQIHWQRFGDANAAIDVIHEMNAVGLFANQDIKRLLGTIREQLIGCTWGDQGPFVTAMAEYSPYDSVLMRRLEDTEDSVRESLRELSRI